jgi:hypothetical protein
MFTLAELYSLLHDNYFAVTKLFLMSLETEPKKKITYSPAIMFLVIMFREVLTKVNTTAVKGRHNIPDGYTGNGIEGTTYPEYDDDLVSQLILPSFSLLTGRYDMIIQQYFIELLKI